ncbi:MFS transporter [Siminovitchia terrae]|uniref:YbfB/YjiJ family MFS transporter n=1 Tax=Siminovitchia terrae TaxID=1914933 RepID=UPI001B15D3C4|nr:YbfB/YjiJ family MFS transporter [Siminovitchia terrae]GIN92874.1 MFS transporter [Siminovitchia terrae]
MRTIFVLLAGIASLMISMGIGRFAYTPLLPFMQNDVHFSHSTAGYLASFNYIGYLLGALMPGFFSWNKGAAKRLKIYLVINIITTIWMGVTTNVAIWLILRLVSGFSSGIVFVLSSSIVLESLKAAKRPHWSGIFYGGVGLGIFLCGLVIPVFNRTLGWKGSWICLGIISALLSIVSFLWTKDNELNKQLVRPEKPASNHKGQKEPIFKWLLFSYGCEGIGYIITGTFIVAIVQGIPQLKDYASLSWAFVGLAAIPSCLIWTLMAKKYGHINTLYVAYIVQIIGVILPVFTQSAIGVFLGAFLFGGTFMGITTLIVSKGQSLSFPNTNKSIGYLTAAFGIGQIIGPVVAGILTSHSNNYNGALIFASAILLLGFIFLFIGHLNQKIVVS